MAESYIEVTEGSGKKLHSYQRSIGGDLVEDEVVVQGEHYLPAFTVTRSASTNIATAGDHILQLMAGSTLKVRLRRITIIQANLASAAKTIPIQLVRLTTAGTGGTSITPSGLEAADTAGATAMFSPTTKGTEGSFLYIDSMPLVSAHPNPYSWRWAELPGAKPVIIPAGASNGIALRLGAADNSASVLVTVEFTESSF